MRLALAAVLLAACGNGPSPGAPGAVQVVCAPRALADTGASAAVDATDDTIYWIDDDAGQLQARSRGEGAIETFGAWPAAGALRSAAGALYWTSAGTVYRLRLGEPAAEALISTEHGLGELEVVGDIVYAATDAGTILWWRSPGEHGELEVAPGPLALAVAPDALWIGSARGLDRVASPGAGVQPVAEVGAVDRLAVDRDRVFVAQAGHVRRFEGGALHDVADADAGARIATTGGGLVIAEDTIVYWIADGTRDLVEVAEAPAAITDLEVRGPSVFVGTADGGVHELCIERPATRPATRPD